MELVNDFLSSVLPYTEWVMLFLVVGGGLFLAVYSKLLPFRYFKHALDITRGKYDHKDDNVQVDKSTGVPNTSKVCAFSNRTLYILVVLKPPLSLMLPDQLLLSAS